MPDCIALKKQDGRSGWQGIGKRNATPVGFGPSLWSRIQEEGINSFEDLTEYTSWSNFIDPYKQEKNQSMAKSGLFWGDNIFSSYKSQLLEEWNDNPIASEWLWIIDIDNETVEVKYTVDVTDIMKEDVENRDNGSSTEIRCGNRLVVYGGNYDGPYKYEPDFPKAFKRVKLAKVDINEEEPDWELMAKLVEDVETFPNEFSKEESLSIKVRGDEEYDECEKCGQIIRTNSQLSLFPNNSLFTVLFHKDCYNEALEMFGSDPIFKFQKRVGVDKNIEIT